MTFRILGTTSDRGNSMQTYSKHEYVCIAFPVTAAVINFPNGPMRTVRNNNI
jgi:hypothetical protein